MFNWKPAAVWIGVLLFSCAVWADIPDFDELDLDGNGYISEEEAQALACLAENFAHIERESAKGLNRSEFEAVVGAYCQRP